MRRRSDQSRRLAATSPTLIFLAPASATARRNPINKSRSLGRGEQTLEPQRAHELVFAAPSISAKRRRCPPRLRCVRPDVRQDGGQDANPAEPSIDIVSAKSEAACKDRKRPALQWRPLARMRGEAVLAQPGFRRDANGRPCLASLEFTPPTAGDLRPSWLMVDLWGHLGLDLFVFVSGTGSCKFLNSSTPRRP